MSDAEDLRCRLQQLQSRFTWDLQKEELQLDDLHRQLLHDTELQLGQRGAMAHAYRNLAYVRYLQGQPEEALSLLSESERRTVECYGEEDERRLIVTYGDLAWLKYHTGDQDQSQSYWQKVQDILVKHPTQSPTVLHPEVYGEKAWTFLKFSKSYYPRAIECFCKALELQPDDCQLNNGYAIALYRTEPYIPESAEEESPAVKQLRRALKFNPDDAVLLSILAGKLLCYEKHEEADRLVERALELNPDDSQVIRFVGKYLQKQNQVDRAIDLLKNVLKNNNQSAFIHQRLGLCYKRKKTDILAHKTHQDKGCEESWRRRPASGERGSTSWRSRPSATETETEVQRWRRLSIWHLEEAIRLKSTMNNSKSELALQYAEQQEISRAQRLFDDALGKLDEEPESIRQNICRNYAEFCQHHTFQRELAITYYKKMEQRLTIRERVGDETKTVLALEFRTNSSDRRLCLKKLKLLVEQRLSRNPGDAAAYGILGDVAKGEGLRRRATEYYEKALERDADNAEYMSALFELRLELKEPRQDES